MPPKTTSEWNERYRGQDTPWDSGLPSRELRRVIDVESIPRGRAIELGCGTGTNALLLAESGFDVTAVDCAALALERAKQRAADRQFAIDFIEADISKFEYAGDPFPFVFDRACYHCVRGIDLNGFLKTLECITTAGSRYLVLTGNANEQTEHGPPRLHEHEIREDLEDLFEFEWIREFRFQDAGGVEGPLGWSCLLTRKP